MLTELHGYRPACFANVASATFAGNAVDALCDLCCRSLAGLGSMNELLRLCLVLNIILILYRFPIRLNFSETPFTYGIHTEPRGFCSVFRRLLTLELITESVKPWGSRHRLLISLRRSVVLGTPDDEQSPNTQ
jgi:hypothetical protein